MRVEVFGVFVALHAAISPPALGLPPGERFRFPAVERDLGVARLDLDGPVATARLLAGDERDGFFDAVI
jgi:hypothetical protein